MTFLPDSFRNRLALLFVGLALLVGLPTYLYLNHIYAAQLLRDRGQSLRDLASAVAAVLGENLRERQREIELLAQSPLYRRAPLDSSDFRSSLERVQETYPQYSWIGLADAQGTVRAATGGMLVGQSVVKRPWFINGRQGPFFGDLHEALLLTKLLPPAEGQGPVRFIDFASPVFDEAGHLRGVLAAHAHWRWAAEVVQVMTPHDSATNGLDVFIVNQDNVVIYPDGQEKTLLAPDKAAFNPQSYTTDGWGDGISYLTATAPVREFIAGQSLGWRIVVRQPITRTLADVRHLQRVVLLSLAAATILFLALVWWSATRFSRPLERLAALAHRIEAGDEKTRLEVADAPQEIRGLAAALQDMADALLSHQEALAQSNAQLEEKVTERTAALAQANAELHQLARRDALTGLANRFAANERLQDEFLRMRRHGGSYGLLMLDIDFFKRINDTLGHAGGDEVLRHVAATLRTLVRESDFIARVGGEEFMVILPESSLADAARVGEKIRAGIAASQPPIDRQVTVSVGVALATPEQEDMDEAVRQADAQLYRAKEEGRNRVAGGPQSAA